MAQASWIGQTLNNRYKIDELLGLGGMSAVYKATDPNLRRVVAVKMIHAHLSTNPDFVRRFEEEAAAVAQLRHPNIVQVFDFNHDEGIYFMVLEFVPGETLQDRLKRLNEKNRRMPIEDAAGLIAQIADAAQYAHERGMIHRDIKPANIILDVYGKAILTDFGIARIMGGQLHTATGAVVGTAMYMSPEQITGERVDERSDVYSLGVTLFEALSGHPPYEADSAMTLMMMHVNDPVPDIRELQPEVPGELAAVVAKALQKKRDLRFQSMTQMAAALRRAVAQEGDEASQPSISQIEPEQATMIEPPQPGVRAVQPQQPSTQPATGQVQSAPVGSQPSDAAANQRAQTGGGSAQAVQSGGDQDGTYVEQTPLRRTNPPPTGEAAGASGAGRSAVPQAQSVQATEPRKFFGFSLPVLIGGGIGVLGLAALVLVGLSLLGQGLLAGSATATPTKPAAALAAAAAEEVLAAATIEPTATETPEPTLTYTPAPTNTPAPPTATPTEAYTATPTVPPGIPYVRINNITLEGDVYIVDYETFEYTEQLPGMHVHFFFDTVTPEQAGYPGSGPWYLWGGPRPFNKYTVSNRPAYAEKMCALVANPNHSIQFDSGNCFNLPEE